MKELSNIPATNNITADIRAILANARSITSKAINTTMVSAYWLIGRRIVIEEQKGATRAEYLKNSTHCVENCHGVIID